MSGEAYIVTEGQKLRAIEGSARAEVLTIADFKVTLAVGTRLRVVELLTIHEAWQPEAEAETP